MMESLPRSDDRPAGSPLPNEGARVAARHFSRAHREVQGDRHRLVCLDELPRFPALRSPGAWPYWRFALEATYGFISHGFDRWGGAVLDKTLARNDISPLGGPPGRCVRSGSTSRG